MERPAAPIGVFDSGVGGLTVVRAIIDALPGESVSYLGDTAHAPYGPRAPEQVRDLALAVARQLADERAKLLVVACNTAAAAGAPGVVADQLGLPVVEVIGPHGRIGVIGTLGTIGSGAYQRVFAAQDAALRITVAACPSFVDFVERGVVRGRQLVGLAQAYLAPLQYAQVDTLVLGCTHYPLIAPVLQEVMGEEVTLVSSAEETAKEVGELLAGSGLTSPPGAAVRYRFDATGDREAFRRLGARFLGPEVGEDAPLLW